MNLSMKTDLSALCTCHLPFPQRSTVVESQYWRLESTSGDYSVQATAQSSVSQSKCRLPGHILNISKDISQPVPLPEHP